MADFRSIQTRMWREDEWFQSLPTDARLFWIYLFSNPSASACGMYRLPLRTMAFESGLSEERIKELLAEFARAGKAYYENGVVWVVRMRENQLGRKLSPKQRAGIENDIAKIPDCELKRRYLAHYGYPMDTLSIGYPYPMDTPSNPNDTVSIPIATLRYVTKEDDTIHDNDTVSAETSQSSSSSPVSLLDDPLDDPQPSEWQIDPEWATAVKEFESNISLMSGSIVSDMLDVWDTLKANGVTSWWSQAITAAVAANKRSWSYVRAVLMNCLREGHPPGAGRANGNNSRGPALQAQKLSGDPGKIRAEDVL